MKKKLTKTKLKSAPGLARHSFGSLLCLGAVILICSSALAQNLFVSASDGSGNIYEFTPAGVRSTFVSGTSGALAFDAAGNLFVAADAIYKLTPTGVRTTFAVAGLGAYSLAFDSAGNLFVGAGGDGVNSTAKIYKFTPGGVRTTFASGLVHPGGLDFDSAGNLFAADYGDFIDGVGAAIYKYTPNGTRSTFVPVNQIGPTSLAIDSTNNLFVGEWVVGSIYKYTPAGVRSTFA